MQCKIGNYVLNGKKELVSIEEAIGGVVYYCRRCQLPAFVRTSSYKNKHFVHKTPHVKQQHNFTQHQLIQKQISHSLQSEGLPFCLEYTFNGIIRADIFLKVANDYYVIEIQRTNITLKEINRRISYYKKRKIFLLWIICKNDFENNIPFWQQYLFVMRQNILVYNDKYNKYQHVISCYKNSSKKASYILKEITILIFLRQYAKMLPNYQPIFKQRGNFYFFLKIWQKKYQKHHKKRDVLSLTLYRVQKNIPAMELKFYSLKYSMLNFKSSCYWAQTLLYFLAVETDDSHADIIRFCQKQRLLLHEQKTQEISDYLDWIRVVKLK